MGQIRAVSGVYETAPEGHTDQRAFLNMVVHLETALEPRDLLERTRGIERERGRVRSFRNAPRTLDIDVLLYGDRVLRLEGLIVPHPRMTERVFVLVPLLEVAPRAVDPRTGRPFAESLARLRAARRDSDVVDVGDVGVRRIMEGEELWHGDEG